MTIAEWATVTGVKAATLYARYAKGWEPERVLSPWSESRANPEAQNGR